MVTFQDVWNVFFILQNYFLKKQSISNWVEKLSSALEDPGKQLFHKVIWIIFLKHSGYQKKSWAKYISKRFEKYNTISGQKTKTKKNMSKKHHVVSQINQPTNAAMHITSCLPGTPSPTKIPHTRCHFRGHLTIRRKLIRLTRRSGCRLCAACPATKELEIIMKQTFLP